jgi:hypothetical protein
MRCDVIFVTPFSQSKPVRFIGRGYIHLLETAAVFEGPCADAFVPLLTRAVRSLIAHWQVRTVPYASIVRHEPPKFPFRRSHHVHFVNLYGDVLAVGFRIRRNQALDSTTFAALLEEYRNACQTG